MRFLIISPLRSEAYEHYYSQQSGLERKSFEKQIHTIESDLNTAPWLYARNLNLLGHDAVMVVASNEFAQKAWAREHGVDVKPDYHWLFRLRKGIIPWLSLVRDKDWYYKILTAQIKHYKPDVLLNMAMTKVKTEFIQEMKPYVKFIMAQFGGFYPPEDLDISCYDLVVSPCMPTVKLLEKRGIKAELVYFGFEPGILSKLENNGKIYDVSFVGTIGKRGFEARTSWLEQICFRFPQLRVWAPSVEGLAVNSPIRDCYQGQAWGKRMYQVFYNSKIVLNKHSDYFNFAHNVKLFEVTGTGALLMTDWIPNLSELFEPGKEVIAYRSTEECVRLIEHYLEHEDRRELIASSGQRRALREHTYLHRMRKLVELIQQYCK